MYPPPPIYMGTEVTTSCGDSLLKSITRIYSLSKARNRVGAVEISVDQSGSHAGSSINPNQFMYTLISLRNSSPFSYKSIKGEQK